MLFFLFQLQYLFTIVNLEYVDTQIKKSRIISLSFCKIISILDYIYITDNKSKARGYILFYVLGIESNILKIVYY